MFSFTDFAFCSASNTVTTADWIPTAFGVKFGVYVQNDLPT